MTRALADRLIRKHKGDVWIAVGTLPRARDMITNVVPCKIKGEPAVLVVVAEGCESEGSFHVLKNHSERRYGGML